MSTKPRSIKKIPWSSLGILFLTYGIFGWTFTESKASQVVWPLAILGVFVLATMLTSPLTTLKNFIEKWFKSDLGAFLSIIILAFLAVVAVTWLNLFAQGLVLFSAGSLARLDIQTSGFKKMQAFWILVVISMMGLGTGGALKFWLFHKM